ncbi:pentapeptide repeat-containing protein [Halodesulfovibrio sp. MK-HDV]|jgi:uncharacterized protein YjbI with pentapeptide repeats|uniref:pentapeptide repeat-containing protein n=1 Tax=Halodesulfovibrio sp. MK-HDV TaxID=2599925 RepID=UPI00136988BE|nr:pentapeptide repeat-containing protein [Halodesulfovibrio sp. MK-HDV]KAF1077695.1 hypothetical protein MKHDV_00152 [Halodesulfovibrio sp. MK-HDV]
MKILYRSLVGVGCIVALLCGLNGCMSQELKTALNNEDAQAVSQLIQNDPDDISGASLKDYKLRGLKLHDLIMRNVNMYNLDLQGAKLTNVTFEDCTLTGVDFSNSEFHNVRFMDTTLEPIGTTRYDVKETTFKNSLLDKVGFGDGSKLLDVLMHSLLKGSSIAIVDSTVAVVVEDHSFVFNDSYLDNLLIDRTDVKKGVAISLSILGGGNVIIRDSSLIDVDLYGLDAKNFIFENNRNSLLRVGGEIGNVKIAKNRNTWIAINGKIKEISAIDNGGRDSGVGFRGEIDNVVVRDSDELSVDFARATIKKAKIFNCNNMNDLELRHVVVEDLELHSLDLKEINSAETLIKNLSIDDVVLKKRSWVRDTKVSNASINNFSILPTIKYDELYEETEGFWNGLLSKQ